MISSVGHVPLNVLKRRPVRAEVTQEDLVQLRRRLEGAGRRRDDGDTAEEMEIDWDRNEAIRNAETAAQRVTASAEVPVSHDPDVEEAMKELDLDAYDSDGGCSSFVAQTPLSYETAVSIDGGTHASFLDQIVAARPVEESTAKDDQGETSEEDEDSDEESVLEYEQGDVVLLATKAEDILSGIEVPRLLSKVVLTIWLCRCGCTKRQMIIAKAVSLRIMTSRSHPIPSAVHTSMFSPKVPSMSFSMECLI